MERYPPSWIRRPNIIKMSILPKLNGNAINIPMIFSYINGKPILKFILASK